MKIINEVEQLRKSGQSYEETGINRTFYFAYWNSVAANTEIMDFDDVIWDKDVQPILENCKRFGIKEFTVSSTYSGVVETLDLFQNAGCKVVGLIKINSRHMNFIENTREIKPAFKLIIE